MMAELPIPEQPVDTMNLTQLRTFVPQMLRCVSDGRPSYGSADSRPTWWPTGIPWMNPRYDTRQENTKQQLPWATVLRDIVRRCYRYHGAENQLTRASSAGVGPPLRAAESSCIPTGMVTPDYKQEVFSKMPALEARVPEPGPLPVKVFAGWNNNRILPCAALPEGGAATDANGVSVPFVEIFICFYCEREFRDRETLQKHQLLCSGFLKPLVSPHPVIPPYKCKESHPDTFRRAERKIFIDSIGLLPRSKLEALNRQRCKEIKCDKIDIEDIPVPKTPTTPRSAKSLISQLSRDLSPPPSAVKLLQSEGNEEHLPLPATIAQSGNCSDGDADSICSSKSDSGESTFNPRRLTSLLAIDLCSPLGQRLKKHIDKLETSERSEYEQYCHTPVKNNALERLRHRPNPYPVTFRKNKRVSPKKCHEYKFATRDRKEFMLRLRTGLTKKGRKLKRQMKPCRVFLEPLSKEVIVKWMTPRKHVLVQPHYLMPLNTFQHQMLQQIAVPSDGTFPSGPSLLAPTGDLELARLLGLRTQVDGQKGTIKMLKMDQVMSEDMQAEMHQQKAVVYKTILTDMSAQSPTLSSSSSSPPAKLATYPILFYNAAKVGRNFGKPLQTAAFSHNSSVMKPPHCGPSQGVGVRGFRGGSVSKENEAFCNRNPRAARRLSMDSMSKVTDLSVDGMYHVPSAVPRHKPEDDVISISSTESEDEAVRSNPSKRPAPDNFNDRVVVKKRRVSTPESSRSTQVVLFRCHLCHAEITCKLGQTDFIQKHFSDRHKVNNIHLLEHTDSNNQKVVTIVEDTGPGGVRPLPASPSVPQNPSRDKTKREDLNNKVLAPQEIDQTVQSVPEPGLTDKARVRVRRSNRLHSPSNPCSRDDDCYSISSPGEGKLLLKRDTSAIDMPPAPEVIVLD